MIKLPVVRICCLLVFVSLCVACRNSGSSVGPDSQNSDQPLVIRAADSPTVGDSREPELVTTPDGRIILSWVEKTGEKHHALRLAVRDDTRWTQTMTVAEGDNWFVNWADFPSVIGLTNGSLAAHWLVKSGTGTYAYNVNIALSKDGGNTWTKPIVPHLDNTETEHGFVSLLPLSNGRVGAIWLDGRNMKGIKEEHDEDKPLAVSMTLRYATIDEHGKIFDEAALDERVCECCQTSAALTAEGLIAVYRDRSQNEARDTYAVRYNGSNWTSPQPVYSDNWEINGCPVNGPSVAAEGRNVVVGWYTGVGETPHVKAAFSDDGGATFGAPIQIDDGQTQGRVDLLLLPDRSALVCWLSGTPEAGEIKVRRVQANGSLGPPAVVAKTDISRSSGFPRMARLGNEVFFAWTEFGKPSRIRIATADIGSYK
jgi:hypothetical protein